MGIGFVVDGIGADYDNAEVIRSDRTIMVEDTLDEILRCFVEAPEDIGMVYFFSKAADIEQAQARHQVVAEMLYDKKSADNGG